MPSASARIPPPPLSPRHLALAACAQTPELIAPFPVDEARYGGITCADLGAEMVRLNRDVALLSAEQSTKRVNDAVGWTHLLYPAHSPQGAGHPVPHRLRQGRTGRRRADDGAALPSAPVLDRGTRRAGAGSVVLHPVPLPHGPICYAIRVPSPPR